MLLVVYVDDMKLAGPQEHMTSTWKALSAGIVLEKPKGDTDPSVHTFLGCVHRRVDRQVTIPATAAACTGPLAGDAEGDGSGAATASRTANRAL